MEEEYRDTEAGDGGVGCLAGYGLAALFISGLALFLFVFLAIGFSLDMTAVILVFLLPLLLFAFRGDKKRKKRTAPVSRPAYRVPAALAAVSAVVFFTVGMGTRINTLLLLGLYLAAFAPVWAVKGRLRGRLWRGLPVCLLSVCLTVNYAFRRGEPVYEQVRFYRGAIGADRVIVGLENRKYYMYPGLRTFFDEKMSNANQVIYVFRTGLLGLPVLETYYLVPFNLEEMASDPDPQKNISVIQKYPQR